MLGRFDMISSRDPSPVVRKDNATTEVIAAEDYTSQWVNGIPEEKKLVRKLDWRILPCTWILYLLGYLDRANIG